MKKILIIEDDPGILEILAHIFNTDIFEPLTSSLSLPVDLITCLSPDVILLDHWLGDRLGGDLCKEIKAHPSVSQIQVIMLSAHHDLAEVATNSHADGYMKKPFDIDRLYKYVEGFANGSQVAVG